MKILLIDDHSMVRLGIKGLVLQIHQRAEVVEASTVHDGLQILKTETPDLVFLDLKLPWESGGEISGEFGLDVLRAICDMEKPIPVIVISGEFISKNTVEKILKAGAASFVPKAASMEVMLEAMQRAIGGGVWLPSEMTPIECVEQPPSIDSLLHDRPVFVTAADLNITEREFDVLRLAMQGNAPWKVARILGINPANTRRYLSRLYSKFGVIDLYGLQSHFAKTGQLLGIISSSTRSTLIVHEKIDS
ncbi:MAG: response regulator transcription factor [Betaproteobacteria bacterium]|nr:response regulator transcription factor [Betaproteobacteria bacterium]